MAVMDKKVKTLNVVGIILSIIGFIGIAIEIYLFVSLMIGMYGPSEVENVGEAFGMAIGFLLTIVLCFIISAVPVIFGICVLVFSAKLKSLESSEGKSHKKFVIMGILLIAIPALIIGLLYLVPSIFTV